MYFGMSLGRVDVDFRGLLPPIFERHVRLPSSSPIWAEPHGLRLGVSDVLVHYCGCCAPLHRATQAAQVDYPYAPLPIQCRAFPRHLVVLCATQCFIPLNVAALLSALASTAVNQADPLAPPPSLIEFGFVASATNGFLAALNELRYGVTLAHDFSVMSGTVLRWRSKSSSAPGWRRHLPS